MKAKFIPHILKIGIPSVLLIVIVLFSVFGFFIPKVEKSFMAKKSDMIKRIVEVVISDLNYVNSEYNGDDYNIEKIQQRYIERFRSLRYGSNNLEYIWILDTEGFVVAHPYRRDLEGTDVNGLHDKEDTYFIRKILYDCISTGDSYVQYYWQWQDQEDQLEKKITYSKMFEPWGWIISTGVYINDIDRELNKLRNDMVLFGLMLTLIAIIFIFIFSFRTYLYSVERERIHRSLIDSQKMDALGHLAGGVAHDFNNMLGGILGASQMLERSLKNNPEKASKYVDIIRVSAIRASELTKKLLSFSKEGAYNVKVIDINEVLNASVELLEHSIDKKIEITTLFMNDKVLIRGDFSQLQNAFINLAINSSHAMPEGGYIKLSSRPVYLDDFYCSKSPFPILPGNFVEVTVEDNGSGIPHKIIDNIFDPFFTTKDQGKGTGLGLSAVRGVVEQHKGAISVYSEVDKGTVFHLFFPMVNERAADDFIADETKQIYYGTGTVMVVDDEDVILQTADAMLKRLGYNVITAKNGLKCLDIYSKKHSEIDVVILDVIMPEMNGKAVFYKLKEINSDVKVILSSGFPRGEEIHNLMKDGLISFISKPYQIEELSFHVKNALKE